MDNTSLPRAARMPEVTMQDQWRVLIEAIEVIVSELLEIWQVEGKWHPDSNLRCVKHHLNLGKFLH